MTSLMVFVDKEIKEQLRTYKTLIIITVLLLFGITSPILAKIMPELIGNMDLSYEINMPPATYLDAFGQFFNNLTQMGVIVVILVFTGSVSGEKTKGTIILMLTKRLSRKSFILSKFISMIMLFTVGYLLSVVAFLFYTTTLFKEAQLENVMLSLFCLWLFMVIIIAITILTSTLSSNNYIATMAAFGGWFLLLMTAYIPKVKEVTPLVLATWNMSILDGIKDFKDLSSPIFSGILLIIVFIGITCWILKKQEI